MSIVLRPARALDAGPMGVILEQFQNDTTWMPKLYSGAETVAFSGEMIERSRVMVAMYHGAFAGFLTRDADEVRALYVAGELRSKGIGLELLSEAKTDQAYLWLKVVVANTGAQKFYQSAGFSEIDRGDGSGNDENLADITLVWRKDINP